MATLVSNSDEFEREKRLLANALEGFPFDVATFAEHATDDAQAGGGLLWRARFVICPDNPGLRWSQRWMPVYAPMLEWALSAEPWVDDLNDFAANPPAAMPRTGRQVPGLQDYISRGIRSLLCYKYTEAGELKLSILLGSRERALYNKSHIDRLRDPKIDEALETIRVALRDRRARFSRGLHQLFARGMKPEELADEFAREVGAEFDWDYVGVFRVEHAQKRFLLVAQCDRSQEQELRLKSCYEQSIDSGMLGDALRLGYAIRVDDVNHDPQHNYIQLEGLPTQSAFCHPIYVGGRIEWLLDCESTETYAFHGPDLEALGEVVSDLESTLKYWLENRLNAVLLNCIAQSAVVVDANGGVQLANQSARDLLGMHEADTRHRMLASFAADDAARALLENPRGTRNTDVALIDATGARRNLLATAYLPSDSFGRWIWLFTDPSEQQWLAALRYARATVEQVAAQARGPLMLAGALAAKIGRLVSDERGPTDVSGHVQRISESLRKADLTYERLARALAGKEQVDLRDLFQRLRAALDANIRNRTAIQLPDSGIAAWGNPEQLLTALKELLRKLVSPSSADGQTCITCATNADEVAIAVTAPVGTGGGTTLLPQDPVELVATVASLAADPTGGGGERDPVRDAIWRILGEGGEVRDLGTEKGKQQFEIRLRRVQVPAGSP